MRVIIRLPFFPAAAILLLAFGVSAGQAPAPPPGPGGPVQHTLPPKLAALVPPGVKLSTPSYIKTPMNAEARFYAEKSIPGNHWLKYKFHLLCFDAGLWKVMEQSYRDRQAGDLAAARRDLQPVSSPHVTRDAPKEKKYTWGTGLTQRAAHHYMGVGKGIPDYIDYQCAYFGIVGAVAFDLTVEGVPGSPDEANQWAENVARAAARITYANVGE